MVEVEEKIKKGRCGRKKKRKIRGEKKHIYKRKRRGKLEQMRRTKKLSNKMTKKGI